MLTTTAYLDRLVARAAAQDRAALRCLYAFLAGSVLRAAVRGLPDARDAAAVTRSTFIEVWHLARRRTEAASNDPRTWLTAITAGRVHDRARIRTDTGRAVDDYDAHVRRELCDLLGPGRAIIRTSPRTFVNVDDLDLALTVIAAVDATWSRSWA